MHEQQEFESVDSPTLIEKQSFFMKICSNLIHIPSFYTFRAKIGQLFKSQAVSFKSWILSYFPSKLQT